MRWLKIIYLVCLFFLFGSGLQAINNAGVIGVAAGSNHSLLCQTDGTVFACGTNQHGELGTAGIPPSQSLVPVQTITYIESNHSLPTTAFSQVTAVAAGAAHCVSLKNDGSAWAWGENSDGQLGTGNTIRSNVPVQVLKSMGQPLDNLQAIAAGANSSLALGNDGQVWSWGGGGKLRKDATVATQEYRPAVAIAAGGEHFLALNSDGTVFAWGDNTYGQLGNGTTTSPSRPTRVKLDQWSVLEGVKAIAAGAYHSLALMDNGSLFAWGSNAYGQLGNNDGIEKLFAVIVQIPKVTGIASGCLCMSSYALIDNGQLYSWGSNSSGELGNGTTENNHVPNQVLLTQWNPLLGVIAVAGGADYFLAILSDGTVMSCGANGVGQLGNDTTDSTSFPKKIPSTSDTGFGVKAIAGGSTFNLAITTDGKVWGWGSNNYDQIQGQGDSNFPVYNPLPTQAIAIAAGGSHSLAITQDRIVLAWGANSRGQLGNGTATASPPEPVKTSDSTHPVLSGVIAIAAGDAYSLALTSDGTIWGWGANDKGQLGQENTGPLQYASKVLEGKGIILIAAGANSSYAIGSDGTCYAWGDNTYGQLGLCPPSSSIFLPTQINSFEFKSISAGASHVLALTDEGDVFSWGSNTEFQLGNGSDDSQVKQCQLGLVFQSAFHPLSNTRAIAAVGNHSLAIKGDGTAYAWGSNSDGELGNGTTINSYYATPIELKEDYPLTGITAITGGENDSCVFGGGNGMLWGCGMNSSGQLGNGTFENSSFAIANVLTPTASFIVDPKDQTVISGQNVTLTLTSNTDATFIPSTQTNTYVISKNIGEMNPIIQTLTYDPPLPIPKVLPKGIAHYTIIPHASATSYSFYGPQVWANIQVPPPTSILQE